MPATDAPTTSSAVRPVSGPRTILIDIGVCLVIVVPILVIVIGEHKNLPGIDAIGAVLAFGLITQRHRWPTPTLAIGLVSAVVATAMASRPTVLLPLAVVLLFNAALHVDRRRSLILGALGLTVFVVCTVILVTRRFFGPELLAGLAWPTLAVAAGDAVRSRREAMAAAVDRAERAERSRDEQTRRRVAEERLHIARELHDVIAHRIAVVNVQAGVAAHLMRADPDSADVALATIRSSARVVLDELTDMLGLLRTDTDSVAPVHPTPTLDDVPALIATFSAAGLSVACETDGETRPVTAPVGLALYRTVQEALTNAHKHGDGAARVRIVTGPSDIHVAIENRTRPDRAESDGSGFGLVGMRERVHAVGGIVTTTGQPSGTFAVHARFPLLTNSGDGA